MSKECDCEELLSDTKNLSIGICKKCSKKWRLVVGPRGLNNVWEEVDEG